MHIFAKKKSSSACHAKGHAHSADNWCGLSGESDGGAVGCPCDYASVLLVSGAPRNFFFRGGQVGSLKSL